MKGYELIEQLRADFQVSGTAGSPVMVRDMETGLVHTVKGVEREVHEDGSVTHWIKVEEF